MSAFDTQVGGGHYKDLTIQPMQYSMANKLDACQHTIIKYVTRFREKGGVADLEKAKHVIEMLIELEMSKSEEEAKPEETDMLHEALIAALKERFGDDIVVRVLGD
jgi:transposase-like protein